MNFKTTLVMLVLLAGIAGAYLWMRSAGPGGTPMANPPSEAFVTGREFHRITIEQDGQRLTLEKQDRVWWQTHPVRFPVEGEAIETLVNAGLSLTPREVFSFADDDPIAAGQTDAMASFGLNPPRVTVTYRSDTGEHELRLGDTNVAGSAYLQKVGDEQVYLVDAALHLAALDIDPKTWRPQKLPTLDASRVNHVSLTGGTQDAVLTRTAEGWSLDPEGGERADADLAVLLATIAQQLQPTSYVSDDPETLGRFGLSQPRVTLTTADATGASQTLRLGQDADLGGATVYATWSDNESPSPVVFTLAAKSLNNLEQITADMLRDPRVVTALPGTIRGLQVNRVGRDTIEINQNPDGSGLRFVEPQTGYDPDLERAARWLTTLTRVEPVGHVRAPREAQAPIALIELRLTGGRTEHVRLYADRDGRDDVILAVREDEAIAALVPNDQVAPLLAPVVTLRDRKLSDAGPIQELRLTRDDGEVFSFTRDERGSWNPQNSDFTNGWESARFDQLWGWVESPRVASWTSMSELPRGPIARLSLGPEKPAYVVNVDQHLGQRTDLPGVFKLPEDIAKRFADEYRQQLLLPYRSDQIDRVALGIEPADTITDLPDTATVARNAQGAYVDAAGERYDHQAECAALFNTLAGLSAKRYVAPLPPEQRQTPIKTWELQTSTGDTHRLLRYNQGVWSLDNEKYFFIDVETDRQLTRKDTAWGQAFILPETP